MKRLFNIFLNKEKNVKEKTKILIDYREKNSLIISELIALGLEIEIKELKVADYIVGDVVIERKTVQDFFSSMINRRLLKQLEELNQYPKRILIIEGIYEQELYSDSKEKGGIHANAIRGFLLSIILKYQVPIIFTKDYQDTAKFISILAKKRTKEIPLNANKKTLNKKERLQFILEGFPGIGPKNAKKLLKEFKTIKNVINAEEEKLKKIIGKKADSIIKLIREEY
ncbi:MAG: ERCC4 domain-containing protein [Candidatus Pacearchaeota archaeon]